jgi:hypothetical protein
MPSYESSMRNLAKARAVGRPPRPWHDDRESLMIRRLVFQWFTSRGNRPSGRAWARAIGISHTWLQKLVREFTEDPGEMLRLQREYGDPNFEKLLRTRGFSQQMRERGELRSSRRL